MLVTIGTCRVKDYLRQKKLITLLVYCWSLLPFRKGNNVKKIFGSQTAFSGKYM